MPPPARESLIARIAGSSRQHCLHCLKWQPVVGAEVDKTVVRRMKTKWAACVQHSNSIWLNPELAKKNPRSLEYIVVHELTHLHERTHNERFIDLMDQ